MIELEKNVENIDSLFDEIKDILRKKNSDYGNSFAMLFQKYGFDSVIIRLSDKMNRLETLVNKKEKPNFESIEDTLKDIIGYCALTLNEISKNKH